MTKKFNRILVSVLVILLLVPSMGQGNSVIAEEEAGEFVAPLKDAYRDYFHIGAAIAPEQQTGEHSEHLAKHYNMLTAENIMKPDAIQPQEGNFTFDRADAMIEFAKENDMDVRFHTLVWHNQTANWVFQDKDGNPMVVDGEDRKSTRLNSSYVAISYAVFCLKKKKKRISIVMNPTVQAIIHMGESIYCTLTMIIVKTLRRHLFRLPSILISAVFVPIAIEDLM